MQLSSTDAACRRRVIDALSEQVARLRARHRRTQPETCSTGLPALDEWLGGGLERGAVHELVAIPDAPAGSLALRMAAQAAGDCGWILVVDPQTELYPPAAAQIGVPLERLLVVRAAGQRTVLWVCEQALRCRGVAAVVAPFCSLDAYASRRLQLAAEAGGSLGLLVLRQAPGHTFATTRLRLAPLPAEDHGETTGAVAWRRRIEVRVLKRRDGSPPASWVLEYGDAPGAVSAHAVPGDGPDAAQGARTRSVAGTNRRAV